MRRRVIGNMMGQPAGGGVDWSAYSHVWDFTDVAGGEVPDLVGSQALTLSGSYTSSTAGTRPTASNGAATITSSLLTLGAGGEFTFLVACSAVYSNGVGNTFGRFFDTYDAAGDIRVFVNSSLTSIAFGVGNGFTGVTVSNMAAASAIGVSQCSNGDSFAKVDSNLYSRSGLAFDFGPTSFIMNRPGSDRAGDHMFVGAALYPGLMTQNEFDQAITNLLTL